MLWIRLDYVLWLFGARVGARVGALVCEGVELTR